MPHSSKHHTFCSLLSIYILLLLAGCGTSRHAKSLQLDGHPTIPEFSSIRFYGDTVPDDIDVIVQQWRNQAIEFKGDHISFLSLSGGGADGAFGAGFLNGWSARGDRPVFNMVTGVSTGALIAPFAFLGPEYDNLIKLLYTTFTTDNIAVIRPIGSALAGDSLMSTQPLRDALETYVSAEVIEEIAEQHRRGRRLIIGTTNLDEMRPVYWDIGAIAQYKNVLAHRLIRNVILASASIPVAFPPVYFKVRSGEEIRDEMHVDGGVTNQVFSYPVGIKLDEFMAMTGDTRPVRLYVIRNDALTSKPVKVEPTLDEIASRSLAGLIRNQGIGDLYRIYYAAKRDGVDFNMAYIPQGFNEKSEELFDPKYMKKLFQLGYDMAVGQSPWHKVPPVDLAPKKQ